ncbi:MAG: ABC transporter permease, partial [Planctomycetaceae bacterium]|nr:ABC transporter permease [Planctomycetaceae bacterium]
MIRPYFTILKDSFREAIASRTLLVALVLEIIFLICIAPLGLVHHYPTEFMFGEFSNTTGLARQLVAESADSSKPASRIRELCTAEQWDSIQQMAEDPSMVTRRQRGGNQQTLVNVFSELAHNPELFRIQQWEGVELTLDVVKAAQDLTGEDSSTIFVANRKLLSETYPNFIQLRDSDAIELKYAMFSLTDPTGYAENQLQLFVDLAIDQLVYWLFGVVGLVVSLLFTSNIVPRSVEAGEISLLLSKPISRPLLFVTKYLGGCAFAAILLTILVGGIWFLLGIRMDLWKPEILWAIPVYLFTFMIYYSASAVTGLIWRNPILAFVSTVLLWFLSFSLVIGYDTFREGKIVPAEPVAMVAQGETIVLMDRKRDLRRWREEQRDWQTPTVQLTPQQQQMGFVVNMQRRMASQQILENVSSAVAYDPVSDAIYTVGVEIQENGQGIGVGLFQVEKSDPGTSKNVADLDLGTRGLVVDRNGEPLVYGGIGIWAFSRVEVEPEDNEVTKDSANDYFRRLLGQALVKRDVSRLRNVTAPGIDALFGALFSYSAADDAFFVANGSSLRRLKRNENGMFETVMEVQHSVGDFGLMGLTSSFVVGLTRTGQVEVFSRSSLEHLGAFSLPKGAMPRQLSGDPDSERIVVLTHDGNAILAECGERKVLNWRCAADGRVAAAVWRANSELLICD